MILACRLLRICFVAYVTTVAYGSEASEPLPSDVEKIISDFKPPATPIGELGTGQMDVGVGDNAWRCHRDQITFQGGAWNMHNPNAGIGLLKASHCQAVCGRDFFCAAFVYLAEGYKNSTTENPTGIMPGSCWKLSNRPWPSSAPLQGFLTCWKPNITNASDVTPPIALAGNSSANQNLAYSSPSVPPVVPTLAVQPNTVAPLVVPEVGAGVGVDAGLKTTAESSAPVSSAMQNVPEVTSVNAIPPAPVIPVVNALTTSRPKELSPSKVAETPESQGGGFPWKWVLGIGATVVVGGGLVALAMGAMRRGSNTPKKKKKRTAIPVPERSEREHELEPLITAQEPDPVQSRDSASARTGIADVISTPRDGIPDFMQGPRLPQLRPVTGASAYPAVLPAGSTVAYYSTPAGLHPVGSQPVAAYPQQVMTRYSTLIDDPQQATASRHIGAVPMQQYYIQR